jgi:hypothetical protein
MPHIHTSEVDGKEKAQFVVIVCPLMQLTGEVLCGPEHVGNGLLIVRHQQLCCCGKTTRGYIPSGTPGGNS